jgi:AbrB family looped-hinge helix DNA binding protein
MATTTVSSKYQIVIPREVRERLGLKPRQRLQVLEKGGIISLIPEAPVKSLRGFVKGIDRSGLREKKDRT